MTENTNVQKSHHRIVIIGGGTGGIMTASLLRHAGETDIALVEPSRQHFYQPLWTLVGGGVVQKESTVRQEAHYIPHGVRWIPERVVEVDPIQQFIATHSGSRVGYDFLVVAAGVQLHWDAIPGLKEAVDRGNASTNYAYELAPKTWDLIRNFKGGTALFHMPGTPIKCPGAPQKIMYLAADHFRRNGILRQAKVIYGSGTASIFGVKEYAAVLNQVLARYGVDARFNHDLVAVNAEKREAIFVLKNDPAKQRVTIPYDMLHAVPPQIAPDFIRQSPLADADKPQEGWVKVDKSTLQHVTYPNVFALGDVAGTPNSKTGAAAAHQAPVVASNLLSVIRGEEPVARYDGYIACPIVTGYGRMVLCEVDYTGNASPRIPVVNTFQERYDMWLLKRYGLPWLYWNVLLRGRTIPFMGKPPLTPGTRVVKPRENYDEAHNVTAP